MPREKLCRFKVGDVVTLQSPRDFHTYPRHMGNGPFKISSLVKGGGLWDYIVRVDAGERAGVSQWYFRDKDIYLSIVHTSAVMQAIRGEK